MPPQRCHQHVEPGRCRTKGYPRCREGIEHWLSSSVPTARMGREAAFVIQATMAGQASRRMRLFRMGRNEVRTVATSAKRTDITSPYLGGRENVVISWRLLALQKQLP